MKYLVLSAEELEKLCVTEEPKEAYELAAEQDGDTLYIFQCMDIGHRQQLRWDSTQPTPSISGTNMKKMAERAVPGSGAAGSWVGKGKRKMQPWTVGEERAVMADLARNMTYSEVASKYGRTKGAICNRVYVLRRRGELPA